MTIFDLDNWPSIIPMTMSTVTNGGASIYSSPRVAPFFPRKSSTFPSLALDFDEITDVKIPFTIELRYPRKKKKEGDVGSIQRYTEFNRINPP